MINVIGYWVSWLRNTVSAHFDDIIWIDNNKILKTYHICGNAAPQLYYFLMSSSRLTTVWDWTWLISLMSSLSLAEVTDARKTDFFFFGWKKTSPVLLTLLTPHPPLRPPSGPSNQPQPAVTICCCIPLWFSSTTFLLHSPPFLHLLLLFCCRFTHTMCFYRLWVFIFIKKQFKMLKYLIFSFVIFSLVQFHVMRTCLFYPRVLFWMLPKSHRQQRLKPDQRQGDRARPRCSLGFHPCNKKATLVILQHVNPTTSPLHRCSLCWYCARTDSASGAQKAIWKLQRHVVVIQIKIT